MADQEKAKCGNNSSTRITKLGGVQIGVGNESGCTSVTERSGMQVKVPAQMLEELMQNNRVINGDEELMAKDRDNRGSAPKTALKASGSSAKSVELV